MLLLGDTTFIVFQISQVPIFTQNDSQILVDFSNSLRQYFQKTQSTVSSVTRYSCQFLIPPSFRKGPSSTCVENCRRCRIQYQFWWLGTSATLLLPMKRTGRSRRLRSVLSLGGYWRYDSPPPLTVMRQSFASSTCGLIFRPIGTLWNPTFSCFWSGIVSTDVPLDLILIGVPSVNSLSLLL